jgi:hypothetical protein
LKMMQVRTLICFLKDERININNLSVCCIKRKKKYPQLFWKYPTNAHHTSICIRSVKYIEKQLFWCWHADVNFKTCVASVIFTLHSNHLLY